MCEFQLVGSGVRARHPQDMMMNELVTCSGDPSYTRDWRCQGKVTCRQSIIAAFTPICHSRRRLTCALPPRKRNEITSKSDSTNILLKQYRNSTLNTYKSIQIFLLNYLKISIVERENNLERNWTVS
jgi:hypothetical protein